jgi:hypothetical protein
MASPWGFCLGLPGGLALCIREGCVAVRPGRLLPCTLIQTPAAPLGFLRDGAPTANG